MSYIRCYSNPEQLYALSNCDGKTYFSSKGVEMSCKSKTFEKFARYVAKNEFTLGDVILKIGRLSVRELLINGEYKIRLKINNKSIDMWLVTWHYFFSHYCDTHNIKREF